MAQIFDRATDPDTKPILTRCATAPFKVSNGSAGSRPSPPPNATTPNTRTFKQFDRWPTQHMCYGIKSRQLVRQLHICRLCSALFRTTSTESIAGLCCRECQSHSNHRA